MVIGSEQNEHMKGDGWVNPHMKDGPCVHREEQQELFFMTLPSLEFKQQELQLEDKKP